MRRTMLFSTTLLLAGYGFGPPRLAAQDDSPVVVTDTASTPRPRPQGRKNKGTKAASAASSNVGPIKVRSASFTHGNNGNYSNVSDNARTFKSLEVVNDSTGGALVTLPSATWSACFVDTTANPAVTRVMFASQSASSMTVTYNPTPPAAGADPHGEEIANHTFNQINLYTGNNTCSGTADYTYTPSTSSFPFKGCAHFCDGTAGCGMSKTQCVP